MSIISGYLLPLLTKKASLLRLAIYDLLFIVLYITAYRTPTHAHSCAGHSTYCSHTAPYTLCTALLTTHYGPNVDRVLQLRLPRLQHRHLCFLRALNDGEEKRRNVVHPLLKF